MKTKTLIIAVLIGIMVIPSLALAAYRMYYLPRQDLPPLIWKKNIAGVVGNMKDTAGDRLKDNNGDLLQSSE